MGSPVRPQSPLEQEFERWKAAQSDTTSPLEAEFEDWKKEKQDQGPGFFKSVGSFLSYPFKHPVDFAAGAATAPYQSAFEAAGPTESNVRELNDPNSAAAQLYKMAWTSRFGEAPPPPTQAVTRKQRIAGMLQTGANAVLPFAGPSLGGAVAGFAYAPDGQRLAGATAGAVLGYGAGIAVRGVRAGARRYGPPEGATYTWGATPADQSAASPAPGTVDVPYEPIDETAGRIGGPQKALPPGPVEAPAPAGTGSFQIVPIHGTALSEPILTVEAPNGQRVWMSGETGSRAQELAKQALERFQNLQPNEAPPSAETPVPVRAPVNVTPQQQPKTDLFGNAVEETVEQTGLFPKGTGTVQNREELQQLARKDEAISPEEMTQRRDVLGAPAAPRKLGELETRLEQMAQFAVKVNTPGMDDASDQMVSHSQIRGLPKAQRDAVQKRIKQLIHEQQGGFTPEEELTYLEQRVAYYEGKGENLSPGSRNTLAKYRKRIVEIKGEPESAAPAGEDLFAKPDYATHPETEPPAPNTVVFGPSGQQGHVYYDLRTRGTRKIMVDLGMQGKRRASVPWTPEWTPNKPQSTPRPVPSENVAPSMRAAAGQLEQELTPKSAKSPEVDALLVERRRIALNIKSEGGAKAAQGKIAKINEQIAKLRAPKKPRKPNRKAVEGFVNQKYRLDDNDWLLARAAELEQRIEDYATGKHGEPFFVRQQADNAPIRGNTPVAHRLDQDAQLYREVLQELRDRGVDEDAIDEAVGKLREGSTSDREALDFPTEDLPDGDTSEGSQNVGEAPASGAGDAAARGPTGSVPEGGVSGGAPAEGSSGDAGPGEELRYSGFPLPKITLPPGVKRTVGELARYYTGDLSEQIGKPLYETLAEAEILAARAAKDAFVRNRKQITNKGLIPGIEKASGLTSYQSALLGDFLRKLPVVGKNFGLTDKELRQVGVVAEAIRGWDEHGNIQFGTFERKPVRNPGNLPANPAQVRYTPQEAQALFAKLSDRQRVVLRKFTLDFDPAMREGLDDFNRNIQKLEFGIRSDVEGYLHRVGFTGKSIWKALNNAARFSTSPSIYGGRRFRKGAPGYHTDLGVATLDAMVGLRLELIKNSAAHAFEMSMLQDPNISQPLKYTDKVPQGYHEYYGKWASFQGKRFAVRQRAWETFTRRFDPDQPGPADKMAASFVEGGKQLVSNILGYWTKNTLLAVETLATNLIGNSIQFSSYALEQATGAAIGVPGAARRAAKIIPALGKSMLPKYRRAIPAEELGENLGNIVQGAPGGVPVLEPMYDAWYALWGAVENWPKRAIEIIERAEAARIRGDNRALQRLSYAERMLRREDPVDIFQFKYGNIPSSMDALRRNPAGKGVFPYPIYPYKYMRLLGRYASAIGRVIDGSKDKHDWAKMLTALTLIGIPAALMYAALNDDDTAPIKTEHSQFPGALDRRNRVPLPARDRKGRQPYARVSKYPFVNTADALAETGVGLSHGDVMSVARPTADLMKDALSTGPLVQAADALRGMNDEYNQYTTREAQVGNLLGSFVPGYRINRAYRRVADPIQRNPKTFLEGLGQNLPVGPAGAPSHDRAGNIRRLEPDYELLRSLTGINLKPIRPSEARHATYLEKHAKRSTSRR